MYTDDVAHEIDTFRSYFDGGPAGALNAADDEPTSPPVRSFTLTSPDAPPPPRVAKLMKPGEFSPPPNDEAGVDVAPAESDEPDATAGNVLRDFEPPPDPLAETAGNGDLDADLLALFEEEEETHAVPEVVRKALPEVEMRDLLLDAREVWELVTATTDADDNAA
jgi:hypothetical protein